MEVISKFSCCDLWIIALRAGTDPGGVPDPLGPIYFSYYIFHFCSWAPF